MNLSDLLRHASPDVLDLNADALNLPAYKPKSVRLQQPAISEHDLQAAVIAECDHRAVLRPEYGLVLAIPNGQYRRGQRMEPGLRAGVPDLFWPIPRPATDAHPPYHGAFIELKANKNSPSQVQLEWIERLREKGYFVAVVWDSPADVMRILDWYSGWDL